MGAHPRLISWVIVGGESGAGARPFNLAWARSLVQQCQAAGVAAFVKQLGAWPVEGASVAHLYNARWVNNYEPDLIFPDEGHRLRLKSAHGSHPDEWPEDLRVRQFPAGHADWFSQATEAVSA